MLETVKNLLKEVEIFSPKSEKEVEEFRLKFLGKTGEMNALFDAFKSVPNESKKEFGQAINILKQNAQAKVDGFKGSFETTSSAEEIDLTKPVNLNNLGSRHPVSLIRNQIVAIFNRIGFTISEGPEIEDDKYDKIFVDLNDDQFCIDLAAKNMDTLIRILKPSGVITTQVGSQDKKPEQVKKWLDVFNKNFGNTTLDRVYIPSFDCSWNFSSSINH